MTTLESHHQNPFSGGWSDWFAPEGSVVLTFQTMKHQLYEVWAEHCMYSLDSDHQGGIQRTVGELTVDHSEFRPEEILAPGIHRRYRPDDPDVVDEVYDVILPHERLHPELCEGWIRRINTEYDRGFELSYSLDQHKQ